MTESEKIRAALKRFDMTQREFCEAEGYPLPILRRVLRYGIEGIPAELTDRLYDALELILITREVEEEEE